MKIPSPPNVRQFRKLSLEAYRFLSDNWWPILAVILVIGSTVSLLGTELLGLTGHHLSSTEQTYHAHLLNRDLDLRSILANPINLPYTAGIYALEKLKISDPLWLRGLSTLFGAVSIYSFYLIMKNWHTIRVAILGTVLFATSAWTLHTSRLATPEVLLMTPTILIMCATWLEVSLKKKWILLFCLFSSLLLIYVPGMIYFVVAGVAWQSKRIYNEMRAKPVWFIALWLFLGIILLIPLFWSAFTAPHNLFSLLGAPDRLPTAKQFVLNLGRIPLRLFVRGPLDPAHWLGQLPLLDVFSIVMASIGLYAYAFRFKLDRTKLLAGIFLAGSLLIALGGGVTISFLMPFVYLLVAGGVTLLLQQWATVFPRNPFAKTLATTIMSVLIALVAFYNVNHYFIAWPNSPETRAAYQLK